MIKDFPVGDSLHLIDLGMMKKCLLGWRDGKFGNYRTKWSASDVSNISKKLKQLKMPSEIHRAVRGLDCLAHWKGLEYRTFLHYISIVILKEHLPSDVYEHFLALFCAVTICSSNEYVHLLDLADTLLLHYVERFGDIYGEDYITSNVHNLNHLVDDVKQFGILSKFSAYPFENKLFKLKNFIRSGNRPLAQMAKRIGETDEFCEQVQQIERSYPNLKRPIVKENEEVHFAQVELEEFCLKNDFANKWFLTEDNELVEMNYAFKNDDNVSISGRSLKNLNLFFTTPIRSSFLHIYVSSLQFNLPKYYCTSEIKCKMVAIPHGSKGNIVFIPLLHTL